MATDITCILIKMATDHSQQYTETARDLSVKKDCKKLEII